MTDPGVPPAMKNGGNPDDISVELSSRRTGMSFQRTRMSADRTLMSVIRTSLSLISFGFTIYQFFKGMREQNVITRSGAPRNFGLALVLLGVLMVLFGIIFHIQFMVGLRSERELLRRQGFIHAESKFPYSYTLAVALFLLVLGVATLISLWLRAGPLQ